MYRGISTFSFKLAALETNVIKITLTSLPSNAIALSTKPQDKSRENSHTSCAFPAGKKIVSNVTFFCPSDRDGCRKYPIYPSTHVPLPGYSIFKNAFTSPVIYQNQLTKPVTNCSPTMGNVICRGLSAFFVNNAAVFDPVLLLSATSGTATVRKSNNTRPTLSFSSTYTFISLVMLGISLVHVCFIPRGILHLLDENVSIPNRAGVASK